MSKAPPIPADQQGRVAGDPDLESRRAAPEGAARHMGENPEQQGQSANTRQNTHRSGKTQDR